MSRPMAIVSTATTINIGALKASCSACSMHQLCLPMGVNGGVKGNQLAAA